MNWHSLWNRLTGRPTRQQSEFDEEMSFHLEMKKRDLANAGRSPEAATQEARRTFGNITLAREQVREAWSLVWLANAWQDLRYALRGLVSQPGFTVTAVLALVLGIGVNAILFNVYNALALAPFAVRDPGQVVAIWSERGERWGGFTWPEYRYLRQHTKTLDGLAAQSGGMLRVTRKPGDTPWSGRAASVSDNYFTVLGVGFAAGRGFSQEAGNTRDPAPEIVLHYNTWKANFAGDPTLVGDWLNVNGHRLRVVGVAAPGFAGLDIVHPAAWIPAPWRDIFERDNMYDSVNACCASVSGRLAPGRTPEEVGGELEVLSAQFRASVKRKASRFRIARPSVISNPKIESMATAVFVALGVTSLLILFLACANVANLQIARAIARRREVAVRLALGAGRWRVMRQMLCESLLLATLAAVISLALAAVVPGRLVALFASEERGLAIRFDNDYRVLAVIAGITLLAALFSGLAPAWGAVRAAVAGGLREGRAGTVSGTRTRRVLLTVQVALSAILVSGTMLMVRAANHARHADPGFSPANVIQMGMGLDSSGATPEQAEALAVQLIERIEALPGVEQVAVSAAVPFGTRNMRWGGMRDSKGNEFAIGFDRVSASFHSTLRIPLRAGAGLLKEHQTREPIAAVINQAAADLLWPGVNPIGQPIQPGSKTIVVGVAPNVTTRQFGSESEPHMWHAAPPSRDSQLLIRHSPGHAQRLLDLLPALARQLDNRFFITVGTYQTTMANALRSVELSAAVAAVLGALSLLLATVGIYGVAAYSVSQRRREIGVRMALGAQPSRIRAMFLGQSARIALIGTALGLAGAVAFGRLLRALLYGISPTDPVALASTIAVLSASVILASWIPARRASTLDPVSTLRED